MKISERGGFGYGADRKKNRKVKKYFHWAWELYWGRGGVLACCCWLFNYAIERKQWNVHGLMYRLLEGNGEPDPYYKEVDKAEEELKKLPYEPVTLQSVDGKTLRGRFYSGKEGVQDVFLAVHGCRNRGTREIVF